jgi:hypothetical protein
MVAVLGGMMMKAGPATALIVTESDFLLQLSVIALDAPSAFGGGHKIRERGVGRQGGQPVFGRFGFAVGPLDQEPLVRTQLGALVIAVGRSHPHAGKARAQLRVGALAPQGLLAVGMNCGKFIQVYASRRCCPARSLCSTLYVQHCA